VPPVERPQGRIAFALKLTVRRLSTGGHVKPHAAILLWATLASELATAQSSVSTEWSCVAAISPADTEFGRFVAVAPGPRDRLAWTDGRSGQFSIRDAQGKVRVVGRQGSGPGEFQYVASMDWVGDSLWVADGRLPRVQVFSDTGRLLRGITAVLPASWGAGGDSLLVGFGNMPLGYDLPFAVLAYTQGATRIDTVAVFPATPSERFPLPPAMALNRQPLLPTTVIGGSPNHQRYCGAVPVAEDRVQLRCVDTRGRVALDRNLTLEPRPLTTAVYDGVLKAWSRGPERTESMLRDLIRRPRNLPLVNEMAVENEGGIWLRRTYDSETTSLWTRVGSDGNPRGSVSLPRGYGLMRADAERVWAISTDADGLQTVHRCAPRR
jgi:hypothetical protein